MVVRAKFLAFMGGLDSLAEIYLMPRSLFFFVFSKYGVGEGGKISHQLYFLNCF